MAALNVRARRQCVLDGVKVGEDRLGQIRGELRRVAGPSILRAA
jgi:hypothetical protein